MSVKVLDPAVPRRFRAGEGFEPNSWPQERFLISEAPELLYSGHRGSSKSRTICEKADLLCRRYSGARVIVARKKREHMGKTTLAALLEDTITPEHKQWGWNPSADGGSTLFYPNGSQILAAGLDNPGRMLSGEFMACYVDQAEELDEDEFVAIGGSLRQRETLDGELLPYHQLGLACNPDGPAHFLFKRFRPDLAAHGRNYVLRSTEPTLLPGGGVLPAGRMLRECIVAGLQDNLDNLDEGYQAWLASLVGRYRDRYVLGLWVAFEGYVFDLFSDRTHVREKPAEWGDWGGFPPPSWRRFRGIDFGYTNPFVCQWWARSPEGVWWMYREVYYSHRLVKDHRETIRRCEDLELSAINASIKQQNEITKRWPPTEPLKRLSFSNTFADHEDAEARAQLANLGLPTNPAVKDVEPGIQTLYELIAPKIDPVTNVASARLYLVRGALVETDPSLVAAGKPICTADEFPLYQRSTRRSTPRDASEAEAPKKGDDHGIDAARYVCHSARIAGEQRIVRLFDRRDARESHDW